MKKLLALLLVVAALMSFVACDSGKELTRGTVKGNVYTNEYVGFTFTKPSSWTYLSDEEIAEAINLGVEFLGEEQFEDALKSNDSISDMMAVDKSTGTNLNLGYENVKKSLFGSMSVEEYISALEKQLSEVSGMTVVFPDEYDEVTLGTVEFTRVVCSVTMQGVKMQQIYYLHKVDNYMVFVTVTIPTISKQTMSDIEAMFK